MLRVGLTGGVASGKSRVAALLAAWGAAVKDADQVVEELYRPGEAGAAAVAEEFGPGFLAADGGVNRARLAGRVLGDRAARMRLERRVHPLVRQALAGWLMSLEKGEVVPTVAVVEAALLVEVGSWRDYHRLVVVEAPLALRRQRALAAGWTAEAFAAVVAAQADDARRRRVANYVLVNNEGEAELAARASQLWQALAHDARQHATGQPLSSGLRVFS